MNAAGSGSAETPEFGGTPGHAVRRACEILRSEGARVLWFRLLGETFYRRMILFERRLEQPATPGQPEVAVTISLLQPSEVGEYAAFRPGADVQETRSRLEKGHLCWVARQQGALVHAIWSATVSAWIRYLDCEIQLAPDEAYIYESYTVPALRRLNINTARSEVMTRYFREHSFSRLLALVMPENPAGINATLRAGYRRAGIIGRMKAGPWRRDFCRLDPGVQPVILRSRKPSK